MNILKCASCEKTMDDFETNKFFRLQDFWGRTREIKPYCRNCYHDRIVEAQRKATISNFASGKTVT